MVAIRIDSSRPFHCASMIATSSAVALEIGLEVAPAEDGLERGDRRRGRLPDAGERLRLVHVHFEPQQVERLDRLGDAPQALGLVVEVEIDSDAHAGTGALAQRRELRNQRVEDVVGQIELGMAEAGAGHARGELPTALVVEQQQVGLERLEAALARLAGGAR